MSRLRLDVHLFLMFSYHNETLELVFHILRLLNRSFQSQWLFTSQAHQLFMCPMANRIAGFSSRACIWVPSEIMEAAFHRVFSWHLIGVEDSCLGDELSCPII